MLVQGFMLTLLNPLVALFFMTAGMQFLSTHQIALTSYTIALGAGMVGSGSALVFSLTSGLGMLMGKAPSRVRLAVIQRLTGIVLLMIGVAMVLNALGLVSF
jgi:threonine/homoserine/homoserine lactone efflux protein